MSAYADTDFVYFDPKSRTVIGLVQWTPSGNVQPLERPVDEGGHVEDARRKGRRRETEYYIWGSYRSLKRLYNIEGKVKDEERSQSLEEAMQKATREAYWDTAPGSAPAIPTPIL